ncbi:MAG TPA: D-2-hydroxyacid dehydrogenase family protein [Candidatus Tectomicrobia bacterium]|nr:D-2-hydroxyacid dehydrogenase family protein [Candidatus Tectomicrobia bacterium]
MPKVAVLDDYQGVALEMADWSILPRDCQVRVFRDHLSDLEPLATRLEDFEIVTCMRERTPFGRDLLRRLPSLRLLVTTGMRNAAIDLKAATEQGVLVCGTAGGPDAPPAELTWGLILALVRHIPREDAATRAGHWGTTVGVSLENKVLGVLGLGRLGAKVAKVGRAFEMSVIAWSQNLTPDRASQHGATLVAKDELFARSDILSIHVQLSARTRGLVGARELSLMKPTAYLINTARGPIVDEAALIHALQARSIAGAGLDVFDQEPLPPGHPLLSLDNTLLAPHAGYVTREQYQVRYRETVEDIAAYLKGEPLRVLNPEVRKTARKGASHSEG